MFSSTNQSDVLKDSCVRSDKQEVHEHVRILQEKVTEQHEEIKKLRYHLRNLFEKQEDEIVA